MSRSNHRFAAPASRRGFTLVEVMATLVLMAIVLPAVMQGVSISLNAASAIRRRNEAGQLAQSKLSELTATGDWRLVTSGDFAEAGDQWRDYKWSIETLAWTRPEVQELRVIVAWPGRTGAEEQLSLSTLVYTSDSTGVAPAGGGTSGTTP